MFNRNTPLTGRASFTPNKAIWRFLVLGESTREVFNIEASSEQEARNLLPICCVAIFAGRLYGEVHHV
ncbi:host cell division inhibitor Icd-like protein [Edwardsiella tarda]|uniref:host cell division inhibitor Icd-like protein n=1 Tax=Edwardsiella tarda TaxID=636 RepID=UPI0010A64294